MNLASIKIERDGRALITQSNTKGSVVGRGSGLLLVKTEPGRSTLTSSILSRDIARPSTSSAKPAHAVQQHEDPFENVRRHFKELISRDRISSIKTQHPSKPIVTRKKIFARFPQVSSSKVLYLSKAQIGRKLSAPNSSLILKRIKRRKHVRKKPGKSKEVRAQLLSVAEKQMQGIVMEVSDDDERRKVQLCQYPGGDCGLPAFASIGLCMHHAPPDPQYGLMQCRYPMDSSTKLRCPNVISMLHSQTGLCELHEHIILRIELEKRKEARRMNARFRVDKELESFMDYLKKPKRNVKRKKETSPLNSTVSSLDESSETESESETEIMKLSHPVPDLPYHCLVEDDDLLCRAQIFSQKEMFTMLRDYHIEYENTLLELAAALTMKYQLQMLQSGQQCQEEISVEDRWNISVEKCQNSQRLFLRNQSEVFRYMALEKDRLENTNKCSYEVFGKITCNRYALPLLNYCDKHAYVEKKQYLFKKCAYPKCTVSAVVTQKYCAEHALIAQLKSPDQKLTRDEIKAALENDDEELLQKLEGSEFGIDFLTHLRRFRSARFPYQDWKALAEMQRAMKKKTDESADSKIIDDN